MVTVLTFLSNHPIINLKHFGKAECNINDEVIGKMKKSKKILSLFLAMLMLLTCFSAISASALTNEQAEAQLAAWNDSKVDLSGVYADMSEKQAKSTMTALDTALAAALKLADAKSKVYTDEVVGKIMLLIYPMLSGMLPLTPAYVAQALQDYPQAAEYLTSCATWDDVDASKIVFGIEPGNAAQFRKAATSGLFLLALVGMLLGDQGLIAFLEAFHTGTVVSTQEVMEVVGEGSDGEDMTIYQPIADLYFGCVFDAIERFFEHPVEYLCDILPDLAYSYDALLAGGPLGELLPPLSQLLGDLLGSLTDTTGVAFPAIDTNKLVHMGTAKVVDSKMAVDFDHSGQYGEYIAGYRVQIDANKPMVFAAVAQYACAVLQDKTNQIAIGRLVVGLVGEEYQEDYDAIVAAAQSGSNLAIADACLDLFEKVANQNAEQGGIAGFFAKVVAFFAKIGKWITSLFSGKAA